MPHWADLAGMNDLVDVADLAHLAYKAVFADLTNLADLRVISATLSKNVHRSAFSLNFLPLFHMLMRYGSSSEDLKSGAFS